MVDKGREKVDLLVAYSLRDPAGSGAAEILADLLGMEKMGEHRWVLGGIMLAGFEPDVLYLEVIEDSFEPGEIIVLSRHSSESRIKCFTVHHTGNPGPRASAGGRPRELGVADPPRARQILVALDRVASENGMVERGFEVSLEATHHGPTSLKSPLVFAEIGSGPEEWRDPRTRRVLAEAVAESISHPSPDCIPVAGFGGGHYARKHTALSLSGEYCYGHIYAKYVFREPLPKEIIAMAFKRSMPPAKAAVIEKKGVRGGDRRRIEELAEEMELDVMYI